MSNNALTVAENGKLLHYSLADLTLFHGFGYPGGVAHGYKVMQRALPLLSPDAPPERREISIRTAFRGPGARDAFEMVTRSLTEGRYVVDDALAQPERGETLMRYVFVVTYRDRTVSLQIAEGIVRDEFITLGKKPNRSEAEEARLTVLKQDMADRVLALPAQEVYLPFES
ncbi:MAG: hypothetical protein ABTQ31_03180 [Rhizobiaceae bacterium]